MILLVRVWERELLIRGLRPLGRNMKVQRRDIRNRRSANVQYQETTCAQENVKSRDPILFQNKHKVDHDDLSGRGIECIDSYSRITQSSPPSLNRYLYVILHRHFNV